MGTASGMLLLELASVLLSQHSYFRPRTAAIS